MKPLSNDTSLEAQQVMFELLRNAPASKKIELTFELTQTARLLLLAGLRQRFPTATNAELRRRLISGLLPAAEVIKAYGFDPDSADS
ncbi:MAG TPA: hypothetical protein VNG71_08970 [Pyrinomonadaceae bacterium]|nr:hypothetical protein [Pyrinomonadaceae bacterium]